ncbi:hypothetical protein HBD75_003478 [Salmonella enterica]|nr:hypothetical protein [Salmonella enterica]EEU4805587.1 hypothetical protein [Salmonella enterica]EEU4869122.1 hypothetical protein [Salmonella enterica]EEU4896454.1 hypothetical protein [Salmonella enterica]EKP2171082.1 hypothetical protein [Salmonella enterica]
MSKALTYSAIVTSATHFPYISKTTKLPGVMCKVVTLGDLKVTDREKGRGFLEYNVTEENDGAVAGRLVDDMQKAFSLGYDYIHITPYFSRQARSKGEGISVLLDYDLVGYGSLVSVALADVKQPDNKPTDSKQPVKA